MLLLGLGANLSSPLGNRFENIDIAISYLETYKINIINVFIKWRLIGYLRSIDQLKKIENFNKVYNVATATPFNKRCNGCL